MLTGKLLSGVCAFQHEMFNSATVLVMFPLLTPLVFPPGLTEIIKFVKPAPIDQEMSKKSKKQQGGGKKKKQDAGDQNLPDAMETMSVS